MMEKYPCLSERASEMMSEKREHERKYQPYENKSYVKFQCKHMSILNMMWFNGWDQPIRLLDEKFMYCPNYEFFWKNHIC